jgi:hypothetical protein
MEKLTDHVAVGVTTAQNVQNLLPVIQLEMSSYRAWTSLHAEKSGWDRGLSSVLRDTQRTVLPSIVADSESMSENARSLLGAVADTHSVAWLIGGGQKIHSLAMWEVLRTRWESGRSSDVGIYADPATETIRILSHSDRSVSEHTVPLDRRRPEFTLDMLFGCFNRKLRGGRLRTGTLDYSDFLRDEKLRSANYERTDPTRTVEQEFASVGDLVNRIGDSCRPTDELIEQLLDDADRMWDRWGEDRRKIFARRCVQAGLNPVNWALRLGWVRRTSFADAFEVMVQNHVLEALSRKMRVADCRCSVEALPVDGNVVESEHDVLLLFVNGSVVSLDAKTFEVDAKDLRARKRALELGAGVFAHFIPVLSLHADDLGKPWIHENEYKRAIRAAHLQNTQRRLPYALVTSPRPVAVVDDQLVEATDDHLRDESIPVARTLDWFIQSQIK